MDVMGKWKYEESYQSIINSSNFPFLIVLIDIWISYNWLTVSNFTVTSSKISEPFRIVLISDLHNHEFGSSNAKLVERIQEQSPDLVIIDGDMINGDSENDNVAVGKS